MTGQRLFISHASEDGAVADRIVAYLEARGAACWISSRDIPPRAIYADAITEAMQACSACAVIVSAASNASKAVKRELELASHYDKPFIPIRIDAAEPAAGVDYYLRNTQWLDFKREGERALDRIVAQMTGAPTPRASPAPPRARGSAMAPLLIAGALLVVGVGGWFAWRQLRPEQPAAPPIDLAGLLGSYHWDGVACGEGPIVTQEDGTLTFTMHDTPTFRHEVLSAEQNIDGDALLVRTRVLEPLEHRSETYTLSVSTDTRSVTVVTSGRTYTWERCSEQGAEATPTEAEAQDVFRGRVRVRRSDGRREVWVEGQGYVPEGSMAALSRPNQESGAP